MSTMRLCASNLAGLLFMGLLGCDSGGGGGGMSPFGRYAPQDPATASAQAESALTQCGGSCSANVAAGRAALAEGDLGAALDAYECVSTP
jgi:hypothetical protein